MPKPGGETDRKIIIDSLLLNVPGVEEGKMFGYAAYYVEGKLFACIYGDGVGIKVPKDVASRLLSKRHIVPFRPLGRPKMREWVQINRARPADYRKDIDSFHASVEFVRQTATMKRKIK